YCHLRNDIRTFHVHRIRTMTVNAKNPKTPDYEVPKDFALDAYVASFPWQHRFHEPVQVELQLSGQLAPLALQLFPGSPSKGEGNVTVPATDLDGLLRYVLSLGSEAKVLGPADAVMKHREMALAIAAQHQEAR